MQHFFGRVLGLPIGKGVKAFMLERASAGRTREQAFGFVMEVVQHHTHKSGALLGAQGIFVIVATYALDHGWPKVMTLSAMLLLIVGALLVTSTLVSTNRILYDAPAEQNSAAVGLLMGRILRYNLAVYLTFASILLLGVGATGLLR